MTEPRRAAVSLIENEEGKILCVWNKRYQGFSLPGGMVEDGETVEHAQERELFEETGLRTSSAYEFHVGEHGLRPISGEREGSRASVVHVFFVATKGTPVAKEPGTALAWLSPQQFVDFSPFGRFYRKVFAKVKGLLLPVSSFVLTVIESPYAAPTPDEVEDNVRYAQKCVVDSLGRGEAPYASHLFFTQPNLLDDTDAAQRKLGIEAGLAWGRRAERVGVYIDYGITRGMRIGIQRHAGRGLEIEYRSLYRALNEETVAGLHMQAMAES